jgi:hypothetical protein
MLTCAVATIPPVEQTALLFRWSAACYHSRDMTQPPPSFAPFRRNQAIGFTFIIALFWAVELLGLPHLAFGEAAGFDSNRVLSRTVVILAVWAWVELSTRRLVKRVEHLEKFLRLCSWCRKLAHDGKWLTTEQYFASIHETDTTHGICPDCEEGILRDLKELL